MVEMGDAGNGCDGHGGDDEDKHEDDGSVGGDDGNVKDYGSSLTDHSSVLDASMDWKLSHEYHAPSAQAGPPPSPRNKVYITRESAV